MNLKKILTVLLLFSAAWTEAKEYRRAGNAVSFRKARIEVLSPTMFSVREGDGYRFAPVRTDLGVVALPSAPVEYTVVQTGGVFRIATDRMTVVDVRKKKSKVVPYKELERYSIERKNSPLK